VRALQARGRMERGLLVGRGAEGPSGDAVPRPACGRGAAPAPESFGRVLQARGPRISVASVAAPRPKVAR
jgi:hypothetical protein